MALPIVSEEMFELSNEDEEKKAEKVIWLKIYSKSQIIRKNRLVAYMNLKLFL